MIVKFLTTHHRIIDEIADTVIHKNILTRGKQTYCPFTDQSITAATAYKRFHDFFTDNMGPIGPSCLEWIQAILKVMEMNSVTRLTVKKISAKRKSNIHGSKKKWQNRHMKKPPQDK